MTEELTLMIVGALPFGFSALVLLLMLVSANQRIKSKSLENAGLADDLEKSREQVETLRADVARLRVYEQIEDAKSEAQSIIATADRDAMRTRAAADAELQGAKEEAKETRAKARAYQSNKQEKADNILNAASANASRIVEEARVRAESIAGDAYKAMKNADHWAKTEMAMRNIIRGYGDAYMVPPDSVLDDLAEDYSHKKAGQELALARQRVRVMVSEGRAADCDYVEEHRQTRAVRFVTDAFNGKVDAILSKLKGSNVGTMEQKIRDAYAMVNHNGKAFRNARITPSYLQVRLTELKWAAATLELREKEREEQREIKARIREEARAQREFEKAQRAAAREEAQLRKAMEKAMKMVAKARSEDREKYEEQLRELEGKLQEAEERNQRAVSMAQLTRSGHVYVISNVGSFGEQVFKIGLTRRLEPMDRVKELGDASVPFKFDVHAMIYSEDAPSLETALHHRFALNQVNKVNPRKEFFRVTLAEVREAVAALGLDVHWTMQAEALEYRESKALEKSLETDTKARESWLARQARWEQYLESVGSDDDDESDGPSLADMPPSLVAEA